mmetsp:Transcript_54908/g.94700  ORF Transcript_54908/g.94700 Transcript_54908/m.94700 type:complete len:147 (+) Transcript_54908:793-1233(+)
MQIGPFTIFSSSNQGSLNSNTRCQSFWIAIANGKSNIVSHQLEVYAYAKRGPDGNLISFLGPIGGLRLFLATVVQKGHEKAVGFEVNTQAAVAVVTSSAATSTTAATLNHPLAVQFKQQHEVTLEGPAEFASVWRRRSSHRPFFAF